MRYFSVRQSFSQSANQPDSQSACQPNGNYAQWANFVNESDYTRNDARLLLFLIFGVINESGVQWSLVHRIDVKGPKKDFMDLEKKCNISPASSREAGIKEGAGSKVQGCLPCRQPHLASFVLKVWIGAEHHLVALGLARGGP